MEQVRLRNAAKMVCNVLKRVKGIKSQVFPVAAPVQTTTKPYICYRRTSYTPNDTKSSYDVSRTMSYSAIIVSSEYEESLTIADRVLSELIKERDITLLDATEDLEDDAFLQIINFKINGNE